MARPKKPPIQNTCKHCFVMFETRPSSARDFCTKKCAQQHKGVDREWMEKRKKTCLEKYGNEIAFKSKEVQDKYKNNLIEKYGVNNPFLVKEFKDKSNNTMIERYGYIVASQNKDISDKISVKLKGQIHDRQNFVNLKWEKLVNYQNISGMVPMFDKEYLEQNKVNHLFRNKFQFQCNKCSEVTEVFLSNGYLPSCKCSDYKGYSLIEDELVVFLSDHVSSSDINLNRRDILPNRQEIDVFIKPHNLAIEINGVYWHSESMGKYKNYHLYKTEKCNEMGINLVHILDYEWIFKKPIIQSIILSKLGVFNNKIYARKCTINEIEDTTIIRKFLNENHMQGYTHASVSLGLYYNNELVSIMTFGKNRFKKNSNEFEMVRFCNKLNTIVVGGASKLFKHFINNNNNDNLDIVSFADRRFFDGGLYKTLGFEFNTNTSPSYIYWKNNNILNRMSCQKHKLNKLLDIFDSEKSEYQNMLDNGFRRVWDCGNMKFIYKKKEPK
jgi:hypothetical protein